MKKIHIVGIVMIATAIFLLTTAIKDTTTYATFADAVESGSRVKIAGQLSKDKEMVYQPEVNPDLFTFFIKDKDGVERKVVLQAARPQDFEMSEQIVVTGEMKGDEFWASDMLLKCPSKYKDEEIYIRSEKES
ncbi:MAG: cytochrome c maturation protein CcmE [Saprospiraceae bacterium]|nr:cytochrome c maturation protein CcmE [Saprospiraceae bacterium]